MSDMPPVTLTYAEYEDFYAKIRSLDSEVHGLGSALDNLKKAAQAVVDHRDCDDLNNLSAYEELQGFITELEEAIPCDDCLQAPCVCP